MSYLDNPQEYLKRVDAAIAKSDKSEILSIKSVDHALSMKQPDFIDNVLTPEQWETLPLEQQRIYKARKFGNRMVRFAVAASFATHHNHTLLTLNKMRPDVRDSIVREVLRTNRDGSFVDNDAVDAISDEEIVYGVATAKAAARPEEYYKHLKRAYMKTAVGSFPPDDWPEPLFCNQDVTLTQAFGRNTFEDSELPTIAEERASNGSDHSTFLNYLRRENFDPGASNRALAETVARQLQDQSVYIEQIMQWEVAYALWDQYPDLYRLHAPALHVVWPDSDFYPTFQVKADSIEVMKEKGLFNPYEFAHPDMMVRALAILGKQGIQADVLAADIPFDEDSTQEWTRDPKKWAMREKLTRVHHVVKKHV